MAATYGRELFRKYMKDNDLSQADVARELRVSESMVSTWLTEDEEQHRAPNLENAHRIDRYTDGKVPMPSWIPKTKKARSSAAAA